MNCRRWRWVVLSVVIMLGGLTQGGVTISPSSPNASESFTVAPSDTAAFSVSIADGSGYVLKSSGFSTSSSSDGFVWVGGGSGRSFSFSIMNSEWITETAVATVTCVWTPAGGGGGGGGTPPPDIYGSAVGTATAGKGTYKVEASEDRAPAGASVGVAATLEDGKGGTKAADSDWTVGGAGELQGPGQSVSAIQVKGTNTEVATATGVYCEDGSMSDSDEITFVGVKSVSCQTITSTTDTPGTNETLYAAYQGTAQTFTVTAAADPGTPWPDGNPTWSGAVPVAGNPAQAEVETAEPGEYLVRASCGDSAKALKITVIKVESETVATIPTNRTRRTIGIGEEVNCYVVPPIAVNWSVTGAGRVRISEGSSTTFIASKTPLNGTVHAKIDQIDIALDFTVIEPDGIRAYLKNDVGLGEVGTNNIGAMSTFDIYVTPLTVSFYNIELREHIPGENWTWPDGTSDAVIPTKEYWSVYYNNWTMDTSKRGPDPTERIYDGTNYVDFSFSVRVPQEYKNEEGDWSPFFPDETHDREYRGSDLKARVRVNVFNSAEGGWMGPWN